MRKARVMVNRQEAGILEELRDKRFLFTYHAHYQGDPISLTMPLKEQSFYFAKLPPFFEGLLPEGMMLESFLSTFALEKRDLFGQLLTLGSDTVGAVHIQEIPL